MTHSPLNTDHPAAQGNDESLSLLLASSIHEVKNNFGKLVFAITDAFGNSLSFDSTNFFIAGC